MTWDAYHRRKDLLREMLTLADLDHDLTLTDLLDVVDPQRSVLEDETAALFEIQMAWFQRLSGHIDRLTTEGAETPEMVAVAAWAAAASDLPRARALLDAHRDAPALAKAFAKERAFIGASAGVPANHPDRFGHAERIIAAARDEAARVAESPRTESIAGEQRPSLMARLRSALAA
jgi:hypothetical protein